MAFLLAAISLLGFSGCADDLSGSKQKRPMVGKTIEQVQEEHADEWMAIPGVVGVGVGRCQDTPCILVFTDSDTAAIRRKVPSSVDGYPVVLQYAGEIRSRNEP